MKLVDILARELKEWPENYLDVGQADRGSLHLPGIGPYERHTDEEYTKADDWFTAIVTREQWQAAVDALKAPAWNGEGLPPVGAECEITPHNTLWGFSVLGTCHGTILAYHDDFVWIDIGVPGLPLSTRIDKVDFRPVRTAEQIKAEKEISDMIYDAMDGHMCLTEAEAKIVCTQLHKAGYRMQVSK